MIGFSERALLVAGEVTAQELVQQSLAEALIELLDFDTPGQALTRSLAVPRLEGMDGIEVAAATLSFRAEHRTLASDGHTVSLPGGTGVAVSFPGPIRVQKIRLDPPVFPDTVTGDARKFRLLGTALDPDLPGGGTDLRLVVRLKSGGGYGPPVYAVPGFQLASPLYDPLLAGAGFQSVSGGLLVTLPGLPVEGVLLQLAHGDSPDALQPVAFSASVTDVEIDALPEGVAVTLETGGRDVPLFDHPPVLAPEAGVQQIAFLPLAGRHLATELETGSGPTLALPLRLTSATPGRIAILQNRLAARYRLDAVPQAPELSLGPGWAPCRFEAAAARLPAETRVTLVARMAGRRLNAGSPDPDPARPVTGVMATTRTEAAAALQLICGEAPEPVLALAVQVAATEAAEITLSLRADAGGLPGAVLGAPAVMQVTPGDPEWQVVDLPEPWQPEPGDTPLWVTARCTFGTIRWFRRPALNADRTPVISRDQGRTWAAPAGWATSAPLAVAAVERVPDPQPAPDLRGLTAGSWTFGGPWLRQSDREFRWSGTMPTALVAALSNVPGTGRIGAEVLLGSRAFLDLTVEEAALFYDPMAAPGQAAGTEATA